MQDQISTFAAIVAALSALSVLYMIVFAIILVKGRGMGMRIYLTLPVTCFSLGILMLATLFFPGFLPMSIVTGPIWILLGIFFFTRRKDLAC